MFGFLSTLLSACKRQIHQICAQANQSSSTVPGLLSRGVTTGELLHNLRNLLSNYLKRGVWAKARWAGECKFRAEAPDTRLSTVGHLRTAQKAGSAVTQQRQSASRRATGPLGPSVLKLILW